MNNIRFLASAIFFAGLACSVTADGWNLPYERPAQYDYSEYYEESLRLLVESDPDTCARKLTAAWEYYKDNYIMSNGLVNHMRRDASNTTIGLDEAVSEGQGYGMLLALLNNDQQTFNRIFEAANQYMWNSGTTSYFQWCWPGCGNGAATDADLDIGLALVFADKLQDEGLWEAYDYRTRAMEIIRSVRQNMTSQDYLLPGDNWGGSGLDNQNPSYYATAWMKVFDDYQSEVDFGAVINKCYTVLSRVPHYNKGQAPDWCTRSGARASGRSLAMGNDGFRTQWRMALDALWFGGSHAKTFCSNSRNTLTNYTSSNPIHIVGQMGLYEEDGETMLAQSYHCDAVAMWACAILGSQDKDYSTKGLNKKVYDMIVDTREYFGDGGVGDHKFYFKQSIAMLGFATFTGQFPNVWADDFDAITVRTAEFSARPAERVEYSRGSLVVGALAGKTGHLSVFALDGTEVFSRAVTTKSSRISLALPRGAYLARLSDGESLSSASCVFRFLIR